VTAAEKLQRSPKGSRHTIDAFHFDANYLAEVADKFRAAWASADPFPHVVIDDFLPRWCLDQILAEFPNVTDERDFYVEPNESRKGKAATTRVDQLGPFTRQLVGELNASGFINFLEELTGIEHLVPDPHLFGGGTHQTERGGLLKIHADFNWDPRLRLHRRLNLILFLNERWEDAWGGHLELWAKDMSRCVTKVSPVMNRAILFYVADDSNHGHPEPLECPEDITRKSLAFFYYTNGRPRREFALPHTTIYKRRPGETFERRTALGSSRILARFVPPIVEDLLAFAKINLKNLKDGAQ
jgi:Rps23 Pro-64 3,4-dihydroxylase Tpa1-like proline 4-hydroxylase